MSDCLSTEHFQQISQVEPVCCDVKPLKEIYPEQPYLLLHAGPAFHCMSEVPAAVKNSCMIAILFEGWAQDQASALKFLESTKIQLLAAQDFDVVVPLAGVVSPSMFVLEIQDAKNPQQRSYAALNEGMQWCTRLGIFDLDMLPHLHWLHGDFSHWLQQLITPQQPMELTKIMQQSLTLGDDGHARTQAASTLLAAKIFSLATRQGIEIPLKNKQFLNESVAFALNFWMASALLILKTGQGVLEQKLIVKAGGNGLRFGYALSHAPQHWITVDAPEIRGKKDHIYQNMQALGTIGDSAVVDILGLGGQVLDIADKSAENLKDYLPTDYATRMHAFSLMPLNFLAGRQGLVDLAKVKLHQKAPLILLGMISKTGEFGRIGGGVATLSDDVFSLGA